MAHGRLLVVLLAVVAALTLDGCSKAKELTTDLIFAKAYAASVEEITSYRLTTSSIVTADGIGVIRTSNGVLEFLASDRVHIFGDDMERLIIGSTSYIKINTSGMSCTWQVSEVSPTETTGEGYGKIPDPAHACEGVRAPSL